MRANCQGSKLSGHSLVQPVDVYEAIRVPGASSAPADQPIDERNKTPIHGFGLWCASTPHPSYGGPSSDTAWRAWRPGFFRAGADQGWSPIGGNY